MWRSIILGVVAVSVSDVASAQPMSLAPPRVFAANTTHGRGGGAAADAA